ncbi:unnamed protein product [Lampetra fluviatilis]
MSVSTAVTRWRERERVKGPRLVAKSSADAAAASSATDADGSSAGVPVTCSPAGWTVAALSVGRLAGCRVSPKSLSSDTGGLARSMSPAETGAMISDCAAAGGLQHADPSPQAHLTGADSLDNASAFICLIPF